MRAAVYTRISADPEGKALGVARQREDCEALAARLGYDVVRVFEENDVSASTSSTKARPQYDEMMAGAKASRYEAILAYSNSRLTRRPREVEDLIELHNRYGTRLHTVVSGDDDLSTADGRMVARIKASVDAAEAERTAERARRAKDQAANEGRHRGGPRPFGWEKDGMTLVPAEAEVIVQAAREILAGRTLAAVARELNEEGHVTSTGKPFSYSGLRDMLCRPRNAGLVSHGRSDSRDIEIVGRGQWPAILDEDTWRAVRDVLTDPSRRMQRGRERKWLGSGLYRCGLCGGPMRVAPYKSASGRRWLYRCTTSAHLSVSQPLADEVVIGTVHAILGRPDLGPWLQGGQGEDEGVPLRAERERLRARLANFEADYAAGDITGRQLAAATARVQAELDAVDASLSHLADAGALASLASAPDPIAAWEAAPLDAQRAIVDALMTVTVEPVGRGRANTGPERVKVVARSYSG